MMKGSVLALLAMADILASGHDHIGDGDFYPKQHSKPTGKLPDRGNNPHNLPEWDIDGVTVYAATKKAAMKKAGKAVK